MFDLVSTARLRTATLRTVGAFAVATALLFGVYLLLEATRPSSGLVSSAFLLVLPAAVCGFVATVADPWRERSRRFYLLVPVWLLGATLVASIFVLREGVVCVVILTPLWMGSGLIGAFLAYRLRRPAASPDYGEVFRCSGLLVLPLVAIQVEPLIAWPVGEAEVTRTVIVDATPERIWPLLRGIADVRPHEGAWNVSQDVIGLPRPVGARLVGEGVGADRLARWGDGIRFRERIVDWAPKRRIGWRFLFDDVNGWGFTDRHLMPDSPYFRVTSGGYAIEPLAAGRTRVTIHTRYSMRTPVNGYCRLWGQFFLGDIETNLLAVVKGRAEARSAGLSPHIPLR